MLAAYLDWLKGCARDGLAVDARLGVRAFRLVGALRRAGVDDGTWRVSSALRAPARMVFHRDEDRVHVIVGYHVYVIVNRDGCSGTRLRDAPDLL
jgi:hypothetical protein